MTGNPEGISSPVRLVPTDALFFTDTLTSESPFTIHPLDAGRSRWWLGQWVSLEGAAA